MTVCQHTERTSNDDEHATT
ncbi:Protein of unknown function [Leuconostoc citreum LBAE C10]|nr:Protein of unknown function [Leuconostoc citreum LBAE C10]